jgi:hypothetical protein
MSISSVSFWQQDTNYWNQAQQSSQSQSQSAALTNDLFGASSTLANGLASLANETALNRTDDALTAAIQSALQSQAGGSTSASPSGSTSSSSSASSSSSSTTTTPASSSSPPPPASPASGTGTVPLTTSTPLFTLGILKGGAVTVTDGTNVSTYTSTGHDTVGNFINAINADVPNSAYVTAGLNSSGELVITSNNNTATITVGGTYAANIGFGPGNITFAPITPAATTGSTSASATSGSSGASSSSGSSSTTGSSSSASTGTSASSSTSATSGFLFNSALALQTGSTAETLLSSNGLAGSLVNLLV